ncbi:hypothetical protein [Kamptonema sp. UHCC 0994]|nr:hypothetical protein [Kamptonema sp. UHCC 0994]
MKSSSHRESYLIFFRKGNEVIDNQAKRMLDRISHEVSMSVAV